MLDELHWDLSHGTLYLSPRLTAAGKAEYADLLVNAIKIGNDSTLAWSLKQKRLLSETEPRRKPSGGYTIAKVPTNAHETLAEGEFNRFYARGLCRLALEMGISEVVVYRAKAVLNPRRESEVLIGKRLPAAALLEDLRTHPGVEPALGLPPGPNSGISIRLP